MTPPTPIIFILPSPVFEWKHSDFSAWWTLKWRVHRVWMRDNFLMRPEKRKVKCEKLPTPVEAERAGQDLKEDLRVSSLLSWFLLWVYC